jgi:hypothetical protein
MWQRNVWILGLGLCVACLDVVSAPAGHTPLASSQPLGEHLWVFHVAGGHYASHIQLLAIGDRSDAQGRRVFRPIPSRAWDGSPTNDFAGFQATPDDSAASSWTLHGEGGNVLRLAYALSGDTATGALTLADGTRYPAFGVRFDSAVVNLIAPSLPPTSYDSKPMIMIRIDDAPATDRDFLQRLEARDLTAEIAVPTRFAGRPNRLTWEDLAYWRAKGMGVVVHSRYHLSTGADAQHFVGETVGGFAEMAAHGLPSSVFVQPGTWRDSIYFDSPAKLRTWRGALLRTFATVSECYAYPYWFLPADTLELGLSHVTISDGASDTQIREWWGVALRPIHGTVFLVHTLSLKRPDQLDWFLDMVAAAKAHGSVRVVSTSAELFGSPAQVTPALPDSTIKLDL